MKIENILNVTEILKIRQNLRPQNEIIKLAYSWFCLYQKKKIITTARWRIKTCAYEESKNQKR